jgi:hypothetical protein
MLASVEGQFTGAEREAVQKMAHEAKARQEQLKAQWTQRQAAMEAAQKRGRLEFLRGCLRRAEARGDKTVVARLQETIRKLQTDLGS